MFQLTTAVRKVRKSTLILETKGENGEVVNMLDSSLETTESEGRRSVDFECDEDFIAPKGRKRSEAHQDSVHRTKSIKVRMSSHSLIKIHYLPNLEDFSFCYRTLKGGQELMSTFVGARCKDSFISNLAL